MRQHALLHIDWYLVAPALVLVILGLTTLFSINSVFFNNQLLFLLLGILLFLFFCNVNVDLLQMYSVPIYIVSLVILFILLLVGIESRGAVRWFDIFGFRLQFSEILKPFLLISLAHFLSSRNTISFKTFAIALVFLFPLVFFLYKQPDLGNAIIYAFTTLGVLLFFGFPVWWFVTGIIGLMLIVPFFFRFLHVYQQQRLLTFFHITNDPLGTSYNAIQAIIAVGAGKFWGKGLGQGTQSLLRFLPERHTDFVFATLSEMLGFIGAAIVIIAFVVLFYRLWIILTRLTDEYAKVVIIGIFSLLLIQFFVNVGMNIGLLPIVGVTLPFVSYGGSSFLSSAILLGLASSISSMSHHKHVLEIG